MTVAEMHSEFKLGMDKSDSLSYPNFLPEEIDIFLNSEQEKFIKNRAYPSGRELGLEETQKRVDDLKNIFTNYQTTSFTTNSSNKPNGVFVTLPGDYLFAMEEEAIISYTDCNGASATKRVEVIPSTHDRYNRAIKEDPFNKPDKNQVTRLGYGLVTGNETFELITDGSTLTTYILRYIKEPVSIRYGTQYETPTTDIDCELSDHTHREIVAMAVRTALENIESGRYNSTSQELNNIE